MGALDVFQESQRQASTGDDRFYRRFLYVFELRVPRRLAPQGAFFFPLAIPPEDYAIDHEFALEETMTNGAGLYTDEAGIIRRTITMAGTTGFAPRPLGATATPLSANKPDSRSFQRTLPPTVLLPISGQRHMEYLQDAVFQTYGDLKRDPSTSEETHLFLHVLKDDEAWEVKPRRFKVMRHKRVMYRYEIELLVVGPLEASRMFSSEDQSLTDAMRDPERMVKSGLDLARGAVDDLTALTGQLELTLKGWGSIVDDATAVLDAAEDFVNGVTSLIQTPLSLAHQVRDLAEQGLAVWSAGVDGAEGIAQGLVNLEDVVTPIATIPERAVNKLRQLVDGLDRLCSHPASFETPTEITARALKERNEYLAQLSTQALDDLGASTPPGSFTEVNQLGTRLTAGDARSALHELGIGRAVPQYQSSFPHRVGRGDTLESLAARYLGDTRLWQQIALLNGLRAPYVFDLAGADLSGGNVLPGVTGMGGQILVPSAALAPTDFPLLPVLGVEPGEPPEVHVFGTDLRLVPVGGRPGARLYDVAIDEVGGSEDAQLAEGLECLKQAMLVRASVEQGTDLLYTDLGVPVVVGTTVVPADLERARTALTGSMVRDARVAAIRSLTIVASGDTVTIEATIEPRAVAGTVPLRILA